MKFLMFVMYDVAKTAELAQVADKIAKTPGQMTIAQYACQGIPFAGLPPNTSLAIVVVEADSNEALAATQYPMGLAGISTWAVPVLEIPVGRGRYCRKEIQKVKLSIGLFCLAGHPEVMQVYEQWRIC